LNSIRAKGSRRAVPDGALSRCPRARLHGSRSIRRDGNLVTITLDIPADATLGVLLDCHLEFEGAARGGWNRVYKRNDVLRVVE
jgi:hypothetical protein